MKNIISARDYNSARAGEYRAKQAARQAAAQLESERKVYVASIEAELKSAVSDAIESDIFQPALTADVVDRWLDYHESTFAKYYDDYSSADPSHHGAAVWVLARPEYIKLVVDVFGDPKGDTNCGLEWIADIETGGDGSIRCNYISTLPARIKRKFEEYKDIIADSIEGLGFDILEAPKNNRDGFEFKITNADYDELIG